MHPFVVLVNKGMPQNDYKPQFSHLEPPELPRGLFERIILAIRREQELRHTRRLAFGFLALVIGYGGVGCLGF